MTNLFWCSNLVIFSIRVKPHEINADKMSQLDFSIALKFCIGLIEEASNFSKSDSGFDKAFSYFESFYFA